MTHPNRFSGRWTGLRLGACLLLATASLHAGAAQVAGNTIGSVIKSTETERTAVRYGPTQTLTPPDSPSPPASAARTTPTKR